MIPKFAIKLISLYFSGIDNTICTYGSIVEFRKGFPLKLVPVKTTLRILLINSNIPRDTKVIVAKVAALRQKYPSVVESIFNAIENIATLAVDRIRTLPAPDGTLICSLILLFIYCKILIIVGAITSVGKTFLYTYHSNQMMWYFFSKLPW